MCMRNIVLWSVRYGRVAPFPFPFFPLNNIFILYTVSEHTYTRTNIRMFVSNFSYYRRVLW